MPRNLRRYYGAGDLHRNPVKRGLAASPEQWRWSSYRAYAFSEVGLVKLNVVVPAKWAVRKGAA